MSTQTNTEHRPLPFFVYGTLRPGQGNDRRWITRAVAEHDGEARVLGFRLVGARQFFPYAIATGDPTDVAYGAVIRPVPGEYANVLRSFDQLEGYPNHYDRVPVQVDTPTGPVECYIYTPPMDEWTRRRTARMEPVPGGDWSAWVEGRYSSEVPATW